MTACATHCEDPLSADLIKLSPHQVQDAGANHLYESAVPLIDRVTAEQVEIFVIPTHKQRRERPVFQPVQPLLFGIAAIPDAAEVAANDQVICFRQLHLLIKGRGAKSAEITMCIALSRCKNYSDRCYKTAEIANCS